MGAARRTTAKKGRLGARHLLFSLDGTTSRVEPKIEPVV
jgi:hypothetical protein